MCPVLLPPGGYPIAVNKCIISYILKKNVLDFGSDKNVIFHNSATFYFDVLDQSFISDIDVASLQNQPARRE
jgi:hypothetical protein